MSIAPYYNIESIRLWDEEEINFREIAIKQLSSTVKRTLTNVNPAWKITRVEGPILIPGNMISESYSDDDIFQTQVIKAGKMICLRPETTMSSYAWAKMNLTSKRLPYCVWQAGKSFRVEKLDGASASKLRFNEFWQLEFQCIYSNSTMADYRSKLIEAVAHDIRWLLFNNIVRIVESDRLPEYSESTIDIEALHIGNYREVASCSIRKDYDADTKVCEIAIGLDRLVEIWNSIRDK